MVDILIDAPRLRNRHGIFMDRIDAGRFLADMLQGYKKQPDSMVLAIPSGGVPVGVEIAKSLELPLDLVIVRKMQIPGNTEAGFGAMTMDGKAFFNRELLARLRLSEDEIEVQMKAVRNELERRNTRFRDSRALPDLEGKTVILVDDGLASGFTMLAAIDMAEKRGGGPIVIAIPTAPLSSVLRIEKRVHRIFCPNVQDSGSFAVAAAYRQWRDLEAEEVESLLRRADLPT